MFSCGRKIRFCSRFKDLLFASSFRVTDKKGRKVHVVHEGERDSRRTALTYRRTEGCLNWKKQEGEEKLVCRLLNRSSWPGNGNACHSRKLQ